MNGKSADHNLAADCSLLVPETVDCLRTLIEIGFLDEQKRPMVSFEVKPMEGQDTLLVIANAKRVREQAWAQV